MKKILISVLVIVLVVIGLCVGLTACNTTEKDTLYVATNCEFDPFEFLDDQGNPTGIDMDIAAALATKLGMELKITDMAFESVVGSVASGSQTIAMAGLTVTDERKESVDFTQTYFSSSQVVIAADGDTILALTEVADIEAALNGKRIGVQNGTTGYAYVSGDSDDYNGVEGATAVGFASGSQAVVALKAGTVDYVIIDAVPAAKLVAANTGITASEVVLTGEDYAYAVKKGDSAMLNKVNQALSELIADGTIESIFQKYGLSSGLAA